MKSLHKFVVNHHCLRCYATKPSQCLGTEMTTKGYLDDREGCWNEGCSNCR
ncbi:hypothetical protein ACJZL1_05875 [Wolbachia endosymbiont of Rhagoletis indifferens]|uniref:hypothetical protein n=1 Tax=Wolbachia endosymbiont of Rhagoletis indifferens TaxID=3383250 RepID=UPI003AF34AC7